MAFASGAAVVVDGVAFGDVRAVQQHDLRQVDRGARGVYRAAIAVLVQLGNQPAVIDMRVGQQHAVEQVRIEVKRQLVAFFQIARSLEHAAVDEKIPVADPQQVRRTGDRPHRAVKFQIHDSSSFGSRLTRSTSGRSKS